MTNTSLYELLKIIYHICHYLNAGKFPCTNFLISRLKISKLCPKIALSNGPIAQNKLNEQNFTLD